MHLHCCLSVWTLSSSGGPLLCNPSAELTAVAFCDTAFWDFGSVRLEVRNSLASYKWTVYCTVSFATMMHVLNYLEQVVTCMYRPFWLCSREQLQKLTCTMHHIFLWIKRVSNVSSDRYDMQSGYFTNIYAIGQSWLQKKPIVLKITALDYLLHYYACVRLPVSVPVLLASAQKRVHL